MEIPVAGRTVTVTSPDKVFFKSRNDTKLDLVNYYLAMGDSVMAQMYDRPVLLQRFPNGAHGSNFFQKRIPDGAPDWLHTTIVQTPNGTESRGTGGGGPRPPRVGGEPRLPRLPLLADTRCRPRALRRATDRPRPWPRHELRHGTGSRVPQPSNCSTSSVLPVSSRPPATADCTSTFACTPRTTAWPCAAPPSRWHESWSVVTPH